MSKKITISYHKTVYTLEYTREAVRMLEQRGFGIDRFISMAEPYSDTLTLFSGAFLAHHKGIRLDDVEEIFKAQKDKAGLIRVLVEMYSEPFNALMAEPEDDGDEGNPTWSVVG